MLTLFTIGCAGDINHMDFGSKEPQKGGTEAERIGTKELHAGTAGSK